MPILNWLIFRVILSEKGTSLSRSQDPSVWPHVAENGGAPGWAGTDSRSITASDGREAPETWEGSENQGLGIVGNYCN